MKILIILFAVMPAFVSACSLKMGYREEARLPYINKIPDNSGLYLEIYTEAARRIGCSIEVIREPKNRILAKLKSGIIDFYPGFNFSPERAEYVYFIPNGLEDTLGVLSRKDAPPVNSVHELKDKIVLVAQGGPDFGAEDHGAIIRKAVGLDIEKAVKVIEKRQADYYIYNLAPMRYFLRQNPNEKVKADICCKHPSVMYLAFSIKSPLFQEQVNPHYSDMKKAAPDNSVSIPAVGSVVQRFAEELSEMKAEGKTEALYSRYF